MEFTMDIDNNDIKLAQLIANEYTKNKEKIFVSSLGVSAFIKYLADCNIQTDKNTSLYKNQKIYQITDIADVNIQGTIIDVRTFVNSDALYIPKLHFENNLIPQYYIYAKYDETKQEVIFKGFLNSDDIDRTKYIQNYYVADESSLSPMENLLEELYNLPSKDTDYDYNSIQSTYGTFIDGELDKSTEIEIIKLLYSSSDYAKDFLEFTQFEFLANHISNFENLLEFQDDIEEITDVNNSDVLQYDSNFMNNVMDFTSNVATAEGLNTLTQTEQPFEYGIDMLDDIFPNSDTNENNTQNDENSDDTFDDMLVEDENFADNNEDFSEENMEDNILEEISDNETDENSDFEKFSNNDEEFSEVEELEDLTEVLENIQTNEDFTEENIKELSENNEEESEDLTADLEDLQEDEDLTELTEENSSENIDEKFDEIEELEEKTDTFEDLKEISDNEDLLEELTENNEDANTFSEDNNFENSADINDEIFENPEHFEELSKQEDEEPKYLIDDNEFEDGENEEDTQSNDTKEEDLEELSLLDIDDGNSNQDIISDDNEENIENDKKENIEINDELDIFSDNTEENSDTNDEDLDLLQNDEIFNEQEETSSEIEPEIVENNEEESVNIEELDDLLNELSADDIQDTIQENTQDNIEEDNLIPTIDNTENNIELQTLFENDNKETPLEGEQLSSKEYSMYVEEPKQKKSKLVVPLVSLCVFGTLIGGAGYLKFAHKNVQETPDTVIDLKVKSIDDFDDETFLEKTETDMLNNNENIATNQDENIEANPDGIQPKDINQSMTDVFDETIYPVTISKIAWEVPENYISSKSFKKYLQVTGVQLQRELQQNLANVTEISKTGKIKISFAINETNMIKNIHILETSGSSEIDSITKKSVQNTVQYIKIPFIPSNEEFVTLTMVINF